MKFYFKLLIACIGIGLFHSCSENKKENLPVVSIDINRFEKDLISLSVYTLSDSISYFKKSYPDFFPLYVSKVIEIGSVNHEQFSSRLLTFISDFTIYRVSKRVQEIFPNLSSYETGLSDAFSYYKNYFPAYPVPKVISCISGFNQSIITSDSLLAISLDKYLGADEEFYKLLHPPVPEYMRKVMHPDKIIPDAVSAWLITVFPYDQQKDNLLSQMIYYGKVSYCTHTLIPTIEDSLLWGFTEAQMTFVEGHEKRMWEYLVEHKKLFLSDAFTIAQFINDAPFTKDFTNESPGKSAVWIGSQIVRSYMKNNKDISIEQLMLETDHQKILNSSKYNP